MMWIVMIIKLSQHSSSKEDKREVEITDRWCTLGSYHRPNHRHLLLILILLTTNNNNNSSTSSAPPPQEFGGGLRFVVVHYLSIF